MKHGRLRRETTVVQCDELITLQSAGFDTKAGEMAHNLARAQVKPLGDGIESSSRLRRFTRSSRAGQHPTKCAAHERV